MKKKYVCHPYNLLYKFWLEYHLLLWYFCECKLQTLSLSETFLQYYNVSPPLLYQVCDTTALLLSASLILSDGKKYSFSFREDTHCWYLLINEMWSGCVMSEEKNDPLIRDLAVQNVLIVDAFLRRFDVFFLYLSINAYSHMCQFSGHFQAEHWVVGCCNDSLGVIGTTFFLILAVICKSPIKSHCQISYIFKVWFKA